MSLYGGTLRRFAYAHLKRARKTVVLRFLELISGYSRQQLTRLVKQGVQPCTLRTPRRRSTVTMARSTSTSAWRRCCTRCSSRSRPERTPAQTLPLRTDADAVRDI